MVSEVIYIKDNVGAISFLKSLLGVINLSKHVCVNYSIGEVTDYIIDISLKLIAGLALCKFNRNLLFLIYEFILLLLPCLGTV